MFTLNDRNLYKNMIEVQTQKEQKYTAGYFGISGISLPSQVKTGKYIFCFESMGAVSPRYYSAEFRLP